MKIIASLVLLCCGIASTACAADDKTEPSFRVPEKHRTISAEDIVREFSAPPVESYTLFPGDEISLDAWAHPEVSGKHVIGPDGKITLPVAGPFMLSGLTREDAQNAIATALSPFYSNVSVSLRVDRYSSWHIYVLGRVSAPGALQFDSQPNLIQVLTRAGSLPIGGIGADKAGLVRCAIFRGNDRIVWIDLKELLSRGNLALNIRLARNDLVYLPDADDQLVYVLGQVAHPGALRLTSEMSMLDAYSLTGGSTEDAQQHIVLIRPGTGKQIDIPLKQILAGKRETNYSLEEGDIVYVPKSGVAKFGYLMQKANPFASFAVLSNAMK